MSIPLLSIVLGHCPPVAWWECLAMGRGKGVEIIYGQGSPDETIPPQVLVRLEEAGFAIQCCAVEQQALGGTWLRACLQHAQAHWLMISDANFLPTGELLETLWNALTQYSTVQSLAPRFGATAADPLQQMPGTLHGTLLISRKLLARTGAPDATLGERGAVLDLSLRALHTGERTLGYPVRPPLIRPPTPLDSREWARVLVANLPWATLLRLPKQLPILRGLWGQLWSVQHKRLKIWEGSQARKEHWNSLPLHSWLDELFFKPYG